MHELPFVKHLLSESEETAKEQGLSRILALHVEVGELSGIEPDCVRLYFETAAEGTAAEGARLHIDILPAVLVCRACGTEFPHDRAKARAESRDPFCCPFCGGDGILKKGAGTGARLVSLEGAESL